MAAWVFYHDITNVTLGSWKLITLGYPEDQCAYQSKLSGLYRIVATIRELATFQDLAGGAILITCDRESALHRCSKLWNGNPLMKHFDLIQATRSEIQNILLAWSWEHVRGHQDEEHEVLTIMEQRNADMDVAAKAHWAQYNTQ